MLNTPATMDIALQVTGWGVVGGVLAFGLQKRLLWPWQYALAAAMIALVGILQLALAFFHSPLTPVAHAAGIVVNTLDDELNSDGDCSLREAIRAANTDSAVDNCTQGSGADVITFDPISATGTITLSVGPAGDDTAQTGDLDITDDLTITGLDIISTTIDGGALDRVFHIVATSGVVNISDLTIQNGDSSGDGGGIFNASAATLNIDSVALSNNVVSGSGEDGGGIANTGGGHVNISNSFINNNQVTTTGASTANAGGVFNISAGSTMSITDTTISGNETVDNGGAIYNDQTINLFNVEISNNSAADGGGIFNRVGQVNIAQSTLSANTASNGNGGGVLNQSDGDVALTQQTSLVGNNANGDGGGIFNLSDGSGVIIDNSELLNNTAATGDGGGLANELGTVIINNSLISGNASTTKSGGGVANSREGSITINSSGIIDNNANHNGGGLANTLTSTVTISDTTLSGNTTNLNGGAIFNASSQGVSITGSTISGNTAQDNNSRGGGIFSSGVVNIDISTISGNTADEGGGIATDFQSAQVRLNGVTIAENTATTGNGGGIFRDDDNGGGGSIIFANSLIASNSGADCTDLGGAPSPPTLTSQGINLIGGATGCSGLLVSDITNVDPLLGPLADNGHTTQTHALLLGSPAIDSGNNVTCETTDQRNTNRINQPGVGNEASDSCDIGAFEFTDVVAVPSVEISDETLDEGDSGTPAMTFAVSLTGATPAYTVTVDFNTADDTATVANDDYISAGGTLFFPPGALSSQDITVFIKGDTTPENDEDFLVNLSANWATLADNQAQGTIANDDLGISISDVSVVEGDTGTVNAVFDVVLSPTHGTAIDVNYTTADGTATVANNDYVADSGTVTFSPGITKQQVTIIVNGDTDQEDDETFLVNLSNPSGGAGLINSSGQGTIINDDDFSIYLPIVIK